jgi:hypothetical protein
MRALIVGLQGNAQSIWDETARDYERRLLAAFARRHEGRRPFANLTG